MKKTLLLIISILPIFLYANNNCSENLRLEDYIKNKHIIKSKIEEVSKYLNENKEIVIEYKANPIKYYTKKEEFEFIIHLILQNDLQELNSEVNFYMFIDKETNIIDINECDEFIIKESDLEENSLPYRAINMFGFEKSFSINNSNVFDFKNLNKKDNKIKDFKNSDEYLKFKNKSIKG